jgi:hypothetical protein
MNGMDRESIRTQTRNLLSFIHLDWAMETPIQENSRPTLNRTEVLNTKDAKETKKRRRQDLQDLRDELRIDQNPHIRLGLCDLAHGRTEIPIQEAQACFVKEQHLSRFIIPI